MGRQVTPRAPHRLAETWLPVTENPLAVCTSPMETSSLSARTLRMGTSTLSVNPETRHAGQSKRECHGTLAPYRA